MKGVMYLLMLLLLVLQGCGGGGDSDKPTVKPGQTVAVLESIRIPEENLSQAAGLTTELTLRGIYSDGTDQDLAPQEAEWHSSNPAVATIENGVATCVSPGEAEITAIMKENVEMSYTVSFTVTDAVLISVRIPEEDLSQAKGLALGLTLEGVFSDNTVQNLTSEAIWESSAPAVATVENGMVDCLSPGVAQITAFFGEQSSTKSITVTDAVLESITIEPAYWELNPFIEWQFDAFGTFSDGQTLKITDQATWSTSDSNVAEVSNSDGSKGVVAAMGHGYINIFAEMNGITAEAAELMVKDTIPERLDIDLQDPEYPVNHSFPFTAKCLYSDGTYGDVTNLANWMSSAPSIATVNNSTQKGLVTSYENPGIADISASWRDFNKMSRVNVQTVTDLELYFQRDVDEWRLYPLPEICDGAYCVEKAFPEPNDEIFIHKRYRLKANTDLILTNIQAEATGLDEGYENTEAWFNWSEGFQPVDGSLELRAGDELFFTLESNRPEAWDTAKLQWSFGVEGKEGIDGKQFLMTLYLRPR